jgi:hypothetical protein
MTGKTGYKINSIRLLKKVREQIVIAIPIFGDKKSVT